MEKVVKRNPEMLGGEAIFAGTRVPIKSLFDRLEAADRKEPVSEGTTHAEISEVSALGLSGTSSQLPAPLGNS